MCNCESKHKNIHIHCPNVYILDNELNNWEKKNRFKSILRTKKGRKFQMIIIRTINVKQNSAWTASQLTLNLKLHQNLSKEHSPNDII